MVAPPNVPSHPLLISVQSGFMVQHIPSVPHQSQGPCTALQSLQQSMPLFLIPKYIIVICNIFFRFYKDLITPDYSSSNCCGNEITFVIGMETPIFSFWMPTASSFCASFLRSTCFWMAIYSSLRGIATCTYLNDCKKLLSI